VLTHLFSHRSQHHCPVLPDGRHTKEWCYMDLRTDPIYRQAVRTYQFLMNASNPLLPEGLLEPFRIDHYSVGKGLEPLLPSFCVPAAPSRRASFDILSSCQLLFISAQSLSHFPLTRTHFVHHILHFVTQHACMYNSVWWRSPSFYLVLEPTTTASRLACEYVIHTDSLVLSILPTLSSMSFIRFPGLSLSFF
jgi:hypothetical protein